jgi:hypothetical protein
LKSDVYFFQGDQIGRIFANTDGDCLLLAVLFKKVAEVHWPDFPASSLHGKSQALIGLGNILGDLFTNASGHPDPNCVGRCRFK